MSKTSYNLGRREYFVNIAYSHKSYIKFGRFTKVRVGTLNRRNLCSFKQFVGVCNDNYPVSTIDDTMQEKIYKYFP